MEDRLALLRSTHLFGGLPDQDLRGVADLLERRSLRPHATLCREGDEDPTFYIVESGQLKAWTRDDKGRPTVVGYLRPGDSSGTPALLTGQRRVVTVEAEEASELLCLQKQHLDSLLQQRPRLREALHLRLRERLGEIPLFSKLSDQDLQRLALVVEEISYPEGATISIQGERAVAFFIVNRGRVALLAGEGPDAAQIIRSLQPGDYFGERSLLGGRPGSTTVRALEDTRLLYVNKRGFSNVVRAHPSLRKALSLEAQARDRALAKRFPWQGEGELLLVLAHKHPYAFFRSLWIVLFPLGAAVLILTLASLLDRVNLWAYLASALLAASSIGLCIWLWIDWYNDYFAITNRRVVHLDRTILVRESREEAPLERIQDISILMPSLTGRLLGFHDLSIQTAGTTGRVVFRTVANAAWIRDQLFQQLERMTVHERAEERDSIRRRLVQELGHVEEEGFFTADRDRRIGTVPTGMQTSSPETGAGVAHLLRGLVHHVIPHMRLEENGVVTWRKHWFRLVDRIAGPAILLFILGQLGIAALLELAVPPARFQGLFWAALAMGTPLGLFLAWFRYEDWRNDIYQLTDERIIDVERLPLGLHEERKEASLSMIQNIWYEIPGVIANLLDYGNVFIETAGREAVFTFSWVHQPRRVQQEVFSRMDVFRERERRKQKESRADEFLDWFTTYADLSGEQETEAHESDE